MVRCEVGLFFKLLKKALSAPRHNKHYKKSTTKSHIGTN
jgi:hypothetical protein